MINDKLLKPMNGKWRLDGIPYSGETKSCTSTLRWYKDGKLHREDGPAVERADEYKAWWIHGRKHREDGPAVEYASGRKEWWIHDEEILTWKQYHKLSTLSPQEQMVVKLKYGEHLE